MPGSSGVSVQPCCIEAFNEIKLGHKYRYIIFSLTKDLTEITVLKTAPPQMTYDHFLEELKEAEAAQECRYAIYDAEYTLDNGQKRTKLVFFLWSPETATIKQKMVYTSSTDYLKRSLVGLGKGVQANDHEDLAWENILEILNKTAQQ